MQSNCTVVTSRKKLSLGLCCLYFDNCVDTLHRTHAFLQDQKHTTMNIFNQIKQFLYSLVDGKPCDTENNMSDTKSNQDLLEEIQVRICELQRRGI